MHVCMHVCMYACMHGCMDAWMHGCMHAWMHGWMDGCMYVPSKVSFRGLVMGCSFTPLVPKCTSPPRDFHWTERQVHRLLADDGTFYLQVAGLPRGYASGRISTWIALLIGNWLWFIDYSWSFLIFIDHWLLFYGKACCERWISSFWGRHSMKKIAYTQQFLAYVQSTSPFWLSATTRPFTKPCVWHHTMFCLASAYD